MLLCRIPPFIGVERRHSCLGHDSKWPKIGPIYSPKLIGPGPEQPEIEPRWPKLEPRWPKISPRSAQSGRNTNKKKGRYAQKRPAMAQDWHPRAAKMDPGRAPRSPLVAKNGPAPTATPGSRPASRAASRRGRSWLEIGPRGPAHHLRAGVEIWVKKTH